MNSLFIEAKDGRRYVLAGGGLQSALLAHAILHYQPEALVTVLERETCLGGNHTWCFHSGDIPARSDHLAAAFTEYSWPAYDVRFPSRTRRVSRPYRCLSSEHLRGAMEALAARTGRLTIRLGVEAASLDSTGATLTTGERIAADHVIDARGPRPIEGVRTGYQKFFGVEAELDRPCPIDVPLLMDARVAQTDGFRFMYVLPLSPTRVLIEDTYFSDDAALNAGAIEKEIALYAAANGYSISEIVRREAGVLPMPWGGEPAMASKGVVLAGFGGGWFHPATGYSFPAAAHLAEFIGRGGLASAPAWRAFRATHRSRYRYGCLLNRLLFGSFEPARRWHVFDRFYGFGEPVIERFYGMTYTWPDRLRLLSGRPPRGISWRRTAKEGFPIWT